MEKPATADHPIHDLIRRRWSPRAFADRAIEPEKIGSLLEAARWAPSSFNAQPWSFILATRDQGEAFDRLVGCLVPANQVWAKTAPLLMISVARLAFEHNDKPNRHALHDIGLAAATMVLQAMALGLFAHQMAGIEREKLRETYRIPEGFEPVAAIAVGYPSDPATVPDELRERETAPRVRKPLSEFVFAEAWGRPAEGIFRPPSPTATSARPRP